MALIGKYNFRGIALENAVVRQEYHPQVFKPEGRVHLIFALYSSQEAINNGERPLIDRFLEIDLWAKLPQGMSPETRREGREDTTRVAGLFQGLECMWGKADPPEGFPANLWAQGYHLVKDLKELEGFVSDEQ